MKLRNTFEQPARKSAARLILWTHIVVNLLGLLSFAALAIKLQQDPHYEVNFSSLAFMLALLISASIALRLLKHSLSKAMHLYAWVGMALVSTMAFYDVLVLKSKPGIASAFHVGIFALGITLNFTSAATYAIAASFIFIALGIVSNELGSMILPVFLAYTLTIPSWLVNRLEEDWKQSEEKFRTVFRESLDVILVLERTSKKILRVNQTVQPLLGFSNDTLIGKNFLELCPPESTFHEVDVFGELDTQKAIFNSQVFLRADGTLCPMELTATLIPWEDNSVILVTLRDITERVRAEAARRESESRYRRLVETSPDSIVLCNLSGQILMSNPQTASLFSLENPQDIIGKNVLDYVASEDYGRAQQDIQNIGNQKLIQNIEYKLLRADSSHFPAAISAARILTEANGETEALIITVRDITERKLAEQAIKSRNQELIALNAIAETINQTRDLDGLLNATLTEVLRVAEVETGWIHLIKSQRKNQVPEMVVQQGFVQNPLNDTLEEHLAHLADCVIKTKQPNLIEDTAHIHCLIADDIDPEAWSALSTIAVGIPILAKENVLGVLGILNHQHQMLTLQNIQLLAAIGHQIGVAIENIHLNHTAAEVEILREVDRMRSELIANVSHDFRTPLGLIKILCTTLLRDDVDFDEKTQKEFLQDIEEEANNMEELVTNVLDLGRIENGRLRLNTSPTALDTLVRQVISAMQVRSDKHQLLAKLPNIPLMVHIDPQRIEEVLRNLVDNAIKYSPEGGTITIEGYNQGSEILIRVRDEGIGIPKEETDKIFERFYRVQNTHTRKIGGSGLGLAVCQGIIKAHNGRIWVESTPGKGSSFCFALPAPKNNNKVEANTIEAH